jgi:hypothetical protein
VGEALEELITIPLEVTVAPPLSVTLPPVIAVVYNMEVAALVVTVGQLASVVNCIVFP